MLFNQASMPVLSCAFLGAMSVAGMLVQSPMVIIVMPMSCSGICNSFVFEHHWCRQYGDRDTLPCGQPLTKQKRKEKVLAGQISCEHGNHPYTRAIPFKPFMMCLGAT